jgi:hypothetical protein
MSPGWYPPEWQLIPLSQTQGGKNMSGFKICSRERGAIGLHATGGAIHGRGEKGCSRAVESHWKKSPMSVRTGRPKVHQANLHIYIW